MMKTILAAIGALALLVACGSTKETKPDTSANSASSASSASTGTGQATVTVNNPVFVRDVWRNVRDISADTRSFGTGGTAAVAGVRGGNMKLNDAGGTGTATITRAELERSVGELRKILASDKLSNFDRSRYGFYLGSCLVELGNPAEAKTWFEKARAADPAGVHGKAAKAALERLAKGSAR